MKKPTPKPTRGTEIAAKARARGNKYSAKKRMELLKTGLAMISKPKSKFNRRLVFRGWVDGNYSAFHRSIRTVAHAFSDDQIMPSDAHCRITVEWREVKNKVRVTGPRSDNPRSS